MSTQFTSRLHAAIRQKQTPALVGIDPRFELLPEELQKKAGASKNLRLQKPRDRKNTGAAGKQSGRSHSIMNRGIVDSLADAPARMRADCKLTAFVVGRDPDPSLQLDPACAGMNGESDQGIGRGSAPLGPSSR